jgi:predicted SAM-dependent methyltransferase
VEVSKDAPVRLNIGAGDKKFEGWTSVGLDPSHDVQCDIRAIPLPDDYADEAMAIHVLEHVYRWEALDTLKEWRRVLKPGGRLVLELPDLVKCCQNFLRTDNPRHGIWGIYGDPGYKDVLMLHKWGWQVDELRGELKRAGFHKIRVREPQFHAKRAYRDMRLEATK